VRDSLWTPLGQPAFRAIWIASVVSNIGTWMQNVGVAWLMTTLTPSPVLVALIQTATSLPVFLVGLPAGALRWGLYQDPSDAGRYLEAFVVGSWAEHLRQHERATMADRAIEERVQRLAAGPPSVQHLVALEG
jgi:hypothetical protein